MKKIIKTITIIIYILIFLYALIFIPLLFSYKPLVVQTNSMEPTLKVGEVIYIKTVNIKEIKENDIVTYSMSNGKLITHRVYKKTNEYLITKGDRNNTVDSEKVYSKNLIGKSSKIAIPYIGFIISFIKENYYIVFILILIIGLDFIINKNKSEEKKK